MVEIDYTSMGECEKSPAKNNGIMLPKELGLQEIVEGKSAVLSEEFKNFWEAKIEDPFKKTMLNLYYKKHANNGYAAIELVQDMKIEKPEFIKMVNDFIAKYGKQQLFRQS